MKLTKKYIIGTHVMFYEVDMIQEFVQSVYNAIVLVDNPENITCDFEFNISEVFEEVDTQQCSKEELCFKFEQAISTLKTLGCKVTSTVYSDTAPKSMVNYRRDLNYFGCQEYDLIIWGESDCLIPAQTFIVLDQLATYADEQAIYNYITTFAVRKMWDESWKVIEHVDFENLPYISIGTHPKEARETPYSIRYTMSIEEMNEINNKVDGLDIRILTQPKFDGSCLIISSNLVKAGANIPPGFFGLAAEDTAFMYSCMQVMKSDYKQFVIKNLLKVHNRVHPNKRKFVKGNTDIEYNPREGNQKYETLRKLNNENLSRIFNGERILSFKDWPYYEG